MEAPDEHSKALQGTKNAVIRKVVESRNAIPVKQPQ